jgi:hypothetical protein
MAVVGSQVLLFTLTSALISNGPGVGLYIFVGNSGILAFGRYHLRDDRHMRLPG